MLQKIISTKSVAFGGLGAALLLATAASDAVRRYVPKTTLSSPWNRINPIEWGPGNDGNPLISDGGASNVGSTYADDTPLTWIFGNTTETKIVAAVLSEPETGLHLGDIERLTGVDEKQIAERIEPLEQYDIVVCSDSDDGVRECKLNEENETVHHLRRAEASLLQTWYEKQAQ